MEYSRPRHSNADVADLESQILTMVRTRHRRLHFSSRCLRSPLDSRYANVLVAGPVLLGLAACFLPAAKIVSHAGRLLAARLFRTKRCVGSVFLQPDHVDRQD